jgi:RNA polymerase sigma-70 factor (ECF subfamily)
MATPFPETHQHDADASSVDGVRRPIADEIGETLLVLQAQRGNDHAFEQLMTRYAGRLKYYARRLLNTDHDVDDLLQEAWLAVFRQLPRLRSAAAFSPWVYRIVRNLAFRRIRDQDRLVYLTEETEPVVADSLEPEFGADDARLIHECLAELSPHHREALTLRYVGEMTYEQIAETIGCRLGTVRSRLFHAKHALRRAVENQNGP